MQRRIGKMFYREVKNRGWVWQDCSIRGNFCGKCTCKKTSTLGFVFRLGIKLEFSLVMKIFCYNLKVKGSFFKNMSLYIEK